MSALEIQNIRKSYGELETLKGIDISLESGEFMVLARPLRLRKIDAFAHDRGAGGGDVRARSASPATASTMLAHPKDRDIAMVFQSYALYPHMSVQPTTSSYSLRLRKTAKEKIASAVRRVPPPSSGWSRTTSGPRRAEGAVRRPAPARRHGPRASSASRRSSCSTSRCRTSMPSCAWRCAPS
jgi:hypothetical protein